MNNFGNYAIERFLLDKITDVFVPEKVVLLNEAALQRIAGESEQSVAERDLLGKKLSSLRDEQKTLSRLNFHKPAICKTWSCYMTDTC